MPLLFALSADYWFIVVSFIVTLRPLQAIPLSFLVCDLPLQLIHMNRKRVKHLENCILFNLHGTHDVLCLNSATSGYTGDWLTAVVGERL